MNRIFIFLLWVLGAIACEQPAPRLVIKGMVTNPTAPNVSFRLADTTYKVDLDSTGAFVLDVAFDSAQYVTFRHGPEQSRLYLMPGSNLDFSIDAGQFDETIRLANAGSEPSNYLLDMFLLEESLPSVYHHFSSPPDTFLLKLDSIMGAKEKLLSETAGLPEDFRQNEQVSLKYERLGLMSSYLSTFTYRGKSPDSLPTGYLDYRSTVDYNDEVLFDNDNYRRFIDNELSAMTIDRMDKGNVDSFSKIYFSTYFDVADSLLTSEKILASMLKNHFRYYMDDTTPDEAEAYLARYRKILGEESALDIAEKIESLRNTQPGMEVPDFTFATMEGDSVSLTDYRGKLVYIDLWATWCGPCLGEQPFWEELIKEIGEDRVAFLGISTDASPEPWKKMVTERNLSGTHLYARGAWQADIMKHFLVNGIPRYILLDTDGRIIDRNAPRPSGSIGEVLKEKLAAL